MPENRRPAWGIIDSHCTRGTMRQSVRACRFSLFGQLPEYQTKQMSRRPYNSFP